MKKSLLDIQQEIRTLDSKVKDISSSIASIYDEINALREDNADEIDYEMIRLMALQFNFGKHPIGKLKNVYARQMYVETLLSLVQADRGAVATVDRLIFIQWLMAQAHLDAGLEDLLKNALKVSSDTFGKLVELLSKQYQEQLIVDALIIANISGQANDEILAYVASLSGVLGIDNKQLSILCILARGVLKQELGRMKQADLKKVLVQAKYFKHYLNDNLLQAAILSQRTIAVKLADSFCREFKWKVKQQAEVEKGDVLATYRKASDVSGILGRNGGMVEIIAPCAGIIFQFRNNYINYGVIAHETDSKDAIKAWVVQRR